MKLKEGYIYKTNKTFQNMEKWVILGITKNNILAKMIYYQYNEDQIGRNYTFLKKSFLKYFILDNQTERQFNNWLSAKN